MMMIPEAYAGRDDLSDELKGFYAYHSCLMEPWDGPAAVAFTNGRVVGATLDRNGLRPGPLGRDEGRARHPRLGDRDARRRAGPGPAQGPPGPGQALPRRPRPRADRRGRRGQARGRHPAGPTPSGTARTSSTSTTSSPPTRGATPSCRSTSASSPSASRQEDLRVLLAPMAAKGEEPIGSMGNDAALAVLSDRRPSLFSYFKQLFAQVTNPPIDPIREQLVMSLGTGVGRERNLLDETPEHAHQLVMDQPILRNGELETLRAVSSEVFQAHTIDITWPVADGVEGLHRRIAEVCDEATDAVTAGVNILDPVRPRRGPRARRDPVAAGRGVGAPPPRAHGRAPARGPRPRVRRAARGPPRRDAHRLRRQRGQPLRAARLRRRARRRRAACPASTTPTTAERNVVKALGKGLLKTISKMGISTIQSYCGAQIFEAVGLERALVERHFTGTASRIGGIGLEVLAAEALERHAQAWPAGAPEDLLPVGGIYAWRRDGEHHMWNPETIALLQHAVRSPNGNAQQKYEEYSRLVNEDAARRATLRGPARLPRGPRADRPRRGRAGRVDRQAVRDRRDVAGVDLDGGARDAGDRDEPPRRALEHGRGRRGPAALPARRQRRPAPLGDQAGRLWALRRDGRTTSSTPTSCRSRWPRARSPARAASSPATRSTSTSAGCATRRPASASSRRRRTTTSTRSRTSSSSSTTCAARTRRRRSR